MKKFCLFIGLFCFMFAGTSMAMPSIIQKLASPYVSCTYNQTNGACIDYTKVLLSNCQSSTGSKCTICGAQGIAIQVYDADPGNLKQAIKNFCAQNGSQDLSSCISIFANYLLPASEGGYGCVNFTA